MQQLIGIQKLLNSIYQYVRIDKQFHPDIIILHVIYVCRKVGQALSQQQKYVKCLLHHDP